MPTIPIQPQANPVINRGGNAFNAYLQKGFTYGRNDSGYFQNFFYEGVNADVTTVAGVFQAEGWTYTVTPSLGAGLSRLEAHAGWAAPQPGYPQNYSSETPENIWELDPVDAEKDLLEADFPQNTSLALSAKESRDALAKILQNPNYVWQPEASFVIDTTGSAIGYSYDGNTAYNDPTNPSYSANVFHLPEADYAPSYSLYLLKKAGMQVFPVEASVIRHTQLVSNQYAVQASYINAGRIISTSSMYSLEAVPETLLYAVPTTPTPSQFIENAGDLEYGWRKIRPAVSRLALFKWRITQNYQLGLWATTPYGGVL